MKDKLGFEIPEHIQDLWREADTVGREISGAIHKIKLQVEKGVKNHDLVFREITQQTVIDLENLWRELCLIIPYALCPLCEGDDRRHVCAGCAGRGFMSKFRYDRCIPRSTKEPRLQRLTRAS